jgi:hypothetical protein
MPYGTVSRVTVCPLGQPNKAIGLESQTEPWLANCPRCFKAYKKPDGTNAEEYGSENLLWKRKSKTTLMQKVSRL